MSLKNGRCSILQTLKSKKRKNFLTFGIKSKIMKKEIKDLNSILPEAYEAIQKTAASTNGIYGVPSGFAKLDKMTSGWQNGELIAIGARTAMGKTAFILSMLKQITVNYKTPALLFSPESSAKQVIHRMMANTCEIPSAKIKSGQMADYEWQQLDYKLRDLLDAPLYIDDTPSLRIEDLCDKAKETVEKYGIKIIVIDYLQLLYNEVKYCENRYLELNYFTRRLKSLARELDIPIIVTSQLNRDLEKREGEEGKRPQLSDLRDSGTICDDCDMVCFIHRPEYYKIYTSQDGTDLRGMAELIIAKHRNGAVGDVRLRFISQYARFQNPEDDMIIPLPPGSTLGSRMNNENNVPPPPLTDNPFGGMGADGPLPF